MSQVVLARRASNGQGIYEVDMQSGKEGGIAQFPGPEELWQRCFSAASRWRDAFERVPFEDKSGSWLIRYYQDIAVSRVLAGTCEVCELGNVNVNV